MGCFGKNHACHERGGVSGGWMVFHVLKRGVGGRMLFSTDDDCVPGVGRNWPKLGIEGKRRTYDFGSPRCH
jgi:hypothetical protein